MLVRIQTEFSEEQAEWEHGCPLPREIIDQENVQRFGNFEQSVLADILWRPSPQHLERDAIVQVLRQTKDLRLNKQNQSFEIA